MSHMSEIEVRKDPINDEVSQWVIFQLEEETYGINAMQACGSTALVAKSLQAGCSRLRSRYYQPTW